MSLLSQLPLVAIWLPCNNLSSSKRFYKDVVGLKMIHETSSEAHFDLGTIRLSLREGNAPQDSKGNHNASKSAPSSSPIKSSESVSFEQKHRLVFLVENQIETVYSDLAKRGVKLKPKKILEDSMGKAAWFNDPDGNVIYLWQPPKRESKNYKDVESLIKHYESISRALADLREEDFTSS